MPKKTTASHAVPGAILVSTEHDPTQDFAQRFNITWSEQNDKNHQGNVWEELEKLRGKAALSAGEIQEILARSVPGVDYPTYTWIPNTKFSCNNVNQPGFYADPEARCQVIRRCDYNGNKWNYLCPNATLFNQITLVCDWYFNIDCSKAVQYYDYSNSRLYHSDWVLLDSVAEASLAG
ncbi:uncharacterized protein LOC129592318 [Paramacrobiotus metropolitanus]|uniref:uncharacterized protein LOC129592318 n=1 Tax=Paramacrobiotus metropolitanus TaxID=2943436 RepID=UPI0024456749|nr:uncharacterized protein LOC129592318 [Paramacrobiotus metropolitanus]